MTDRGGLLTRRGLLRVGGGAAGGLGAVALLAGAAAPGAADAGSGAGALTAADLAALTGDQQLPYAGTHQPGVVAPQQALSRLTAFDLTPGATRQQAAALLRTWSGIAADCMAARPTAGDDAMAAGRGPASLTVTFGLGASLLSKVGLDAQVPDALTPLPAFPGDQLDPASSDGDLAVLVAGNDGMVVAHAQRALVRAAGSLAVQRWQVAGFSDAPGSMPTPTATPRNLMGQLDGTDNPTPAQPGFAAAVFVGPSGDPPWMRGGSYLVTRRIRMLLDDWDGLTRARQEAVIGRSKDSGAPLSGGTEHTPPDYDAQTPDGALAIPADAHIRLANPQANQGATILRRGFSYDRGARPDGAPDAGLMFLAYQADPRTGFVPIQQKLSFADALSSLVVHEASALFAVPGGCPPGGYPGQALFEG